MQEQNYYEDGYCDNLPEPNPPGGGVYRKGMLIGQMARLCALDSGEPPPVPGTPTGFVRRCLPSERAHLIGTPAAEGFG